MGGGQVLCPRCGGAMRSQSILCRSCWIGSPLPRPGNPTVRRRRDVRRRLRAEACPGCGGPRSRHAERCHLCRVALPMERRTCETCDRPYRVRDPDSMAGRCLTCWRKRSPLVRLFARAVQVGDCQVVPGAGGYPKVMGGRANRLVLESVLGRPLRPGMMACHTDNPRCIRPAHLYEGTASQNMRDAMRRNPFRRAWKRAMAQAMREAAAKARTEARGA